MIRHGAILISQIHRYAQHTMEQIVCYYLKDGIWLKIKKVLSQIKKLNYQTKMELTVTQMTE